RPLGNKEALRTPLADISKQFQALAGNVEGAFEQQTQIQQQACQGDLEIIWAQLMEVISNWKAEQQVREESYLQRISSLELEVSKLRTELMATNQQAPISDLPAHPDQAHRPASRAASNNQIKDQQPKTPTQRPLEALKQLAKKGTSYADVAALMATRPGGQEWQVVMEIENEEISEVPRVSGCSSVFCSAHMSRFVLSFAEFYVGNQGYN
ncbi:hypothetical protein T310_0001, partial [Rasamsonia emersonii CBS 393.64]